MLLCKHELRTNECGFCTAPGQEGAHPGAIRYESLTRRSEAIWQILLGAKVPLTLEEISKKITLPTRSTAEVIRFLRNELGDERRVASRNVASGWLRPAADAPKAYCYWVASNGSDFAARTDTSLRTAATRMFTDVATLRSVMKAQERHGKSSPALGGLIRDLEYLAGKMQSLLGSEALV